MSLSAGDRLGPYEILAPLGAGGMGEVFRAHDPRIGRQVAIKVLPAPFARDADRLRRFATEMLATGALSHPNILAIYDTGTHEGSPYIVSELLEGQSLRECMAGGALPQRKAIEYAAAMARGLASAHERGIVHRDLKPENVFITRDGHVKILDFGLAKLIERGPGSASGASPTVTVGTEPGIMLGTMGYMAPEQVRGLEVDHRADIFSFGAILYEMISGKRAFPGSTTADVITAILKEDPVLPGDSPVSRIVVRCLEKNPQERFQSARDLAFDLDALTVASTTGRAAAPPVKPAKPLGWLVAVVALAALVVALGLWIATRSAGSAAAPAYQQLTFRRGGISSARFAPDGQTVVYGAAWEGNPIELFSVRPESPESRPLGLPSADILAISSSGEMAIGMGRNFLDWWPGVATLARVPLGGGVPREMLENVRAADWSRDGQLAVVRQVAGRSRLEYPPGKVLYDTSGGISHARVSPDGTEVAFIDHPLPPDDTGLVTVVNRGGKTRVLTPQYDSAQGLAWTRSGEEVWYTAAEAGINAALRAVTVRGTPKIRVVARIPGRLVLHDISHDGKVLVSSESQRNGCAGLFPGADAERDVSWLDLSFISDLSDDGRTALISEEGAGGGEAYAVYFRKTDGSPAVRLGDGDAISLSPDGKWALTLLRNSPRQLVLLPTGAGEPRTLPRGSVEPFHAAWFPDGKRLALAAEEKGHAGRVYLQDINGGLPHPALPEGFILARGRPVSPDGKRIAVIDSSERAWLYPVDGGPGEPIRGLDPGDNPVRWSADGTFLFAYNTHGMPNIYRLEIATGRKELWKQLRPADPTGFVPFFFVQVTPDGKSYAYTYSRILDNLFMANGLQ